MKDEDSKDSALSGLLTPKAKERKTAAPARAIPAAGFKCKAPSAWNITKGAKDGLITAVCAKTRESFDGTIAEFNKRLSDR